jgi:hypothetical protein
MSGTELNFVIKNRNEIRFATSRETAVQQLITAMMCITKNDH